MTDRQTIIKQRVIIVLLVVVIIAGLMATAGMVVDLSDEVDALETLNESMRTHLAEKDARIELLEGRIDVLEGER